MKLLITKEEYQWLGRRLARLTQALQGRSKEHAKLIKETAAKFAGEREVNSANQVAVPVQRRHLRLLQEIQKLSVRAIEEGTIKELEARIADGKGEPGYYAQKRTEATQLLQETKALLVKIEACL